MEMPVLCSRCGEWVELNDTRQSPYKDDLVCRSCFDKLSERKELENEIFELEIDFENNAEYLQTKNGNTASN